MEVSNGVGVVKFLFQPVKNKLTYFIFISFQSREPFPGSLYLVAEEVKNKKQYVHVLFTVLMCCSLHLINDIPHLDPSDSLIFTMVVGREGSTATGSGIIGYSSLSSVSSTSSSL